MTYEETTSCAEGTGGRSRRFTRVDRALLIARFESSDDIRLIAQDFGMTPKAAYLSRLDRLLRRLRDAELCAGVNPTEALAALDCLREAGSCPHVHCSDRRD